jgi:hypothetical protein
MISLLKKITTKAKQLYKTGKYAKWTDAIKEASKSFNKKPAKKKIGYNKERLNIVKKATPYIKNYKSKGYTKQESLKNGNLDAAYMGTTKKKIIKKKATKKATPKSLHKDTMSHNVKISVMSGTPRMYFINKQNELDKIKSLIKYNNEIEQHLNSWKYRLKTDKSQTFVKFQKKQVKESILKYTKLLKSNKKYLIELKKAI